MEKNIISNKCICESTKEDYEAKLFRKKKKYRKRYSLTIERIKHHDFKTLTDIFSGPLGQEQNYNMVYPYVTKPLKQTTDCQIPQWIIDREKRIHHIPHEMPNNTRPGDVLTHSSSILPWEETVRTVDEKKEDPSLPTSSQQRCYSLLSSLRFNRRGANYIRRKKQCIAMHEITESTNELYDHLVKNFMSVINISRDKDIGLEKFRSEMKKLRHEINERLHHKLVSENWLQTAGRKDLRVKHLQDRIISEFVRAGDLGKQKYQENIKIFRFFFQFFIDNARKEILSF